MLGKLTGDTHACVGNAAKIDADIEDLLVEDCLFGQCELMGIEMTKVIDTVQLRPRLVRVRVSNVGNYGVSYGHCVQGYGENIIVDGAGGVGIELAGDDVQGRVRDTTLVACDVRNVTNPDGQSFAYTIDKANDCLLLGCRATDITAVPTNGAGGVYVYMSERATISDCVFTNAGGAAIHLYRGAGANTGGFHVIDGCSFRDTVNIATGRNAVFVNDINTVVRNNTAFKRAAGTMSFEAACTAGASVVCDAGAPVTTGSFTGSNLIIPVP